MKKFCPPLKKVQGGSVCCSLIHRVNPKSPSESSQNPDDLADGCSVNEEESPNGQFIVGNESVPLVDSSGSVDLQESGLEADLGDPPRMAPEVIEQKIREIARDIALQCNKSNTNVADKRNDQQNVAKTKQRLTYHEKRNKNHQLFNENIKEDSMDNSTMYSCKTCSSFPSTINRIAAERHAKTHGMHKERKRDRILSYKCSFCEEKFRTKRANIEHYQTKHCEKGLRRITCTKCLKCFDDTASLKLHIKTVHLELKGYQCDQCEKTFRDLYSLNIHIQSHSEVHHLCSLCGNMFELKWLLNRHIQSVHKGVKIFKCIRCDKSFRDKYGLTRHISEGHRGNEMQENMGEEVDNSDDKENMSPGMIQQQKKKQVCPLCQQSVKRLNKHLKAKHGVNKFFNSDFGQNNYQCKSCGKPMRDKFNLTRHETNCEKEKQTTFQCDNCGKKFFSKQNLKIHVKMIHKTSKSCGKCKVIFETKYQFYEHLPCQHTCECLQQFSSFRSLILHQKKCTTSNGGVSESEYHNVISYKCGVCAIDGIPGEDLRRHVENHEVKDSISRCGLCLLDVSNLVDHIFDKHHVVRRLKKSYIQFKAQVTVLKAAIPDKSRSAFQENSENLLNLSSIVVVKEAASVNAEAAPSAFAVKSKPNVQVGDSTKQPKPWVCHVLDIVSPPAASPPGFIEDQDGDSSKHVISSVSQEVVEIATSDGGKTASITGFVGAVKSKPDAQVEDDSLPESSSSCQNVDEVAVTDGGCFANWTYCF